MTYQRHAVEAILTGGHDTLHAREGIAVQHRVAVHARSRCVLEPESSVHDAAQVWVNALGTVAVELRKGQVEHGSVAGAHEMRAVALDELVASS